MRHSSSWSHHLGWKPDVDDVDGNKLRILVTKVICGRELARSAGMGLPFPCLFPFATRPLVFTGL